MTNPLLGPLAGLRVLDMATVVAAPFGAALCADAGADVVKLELPDGNDPLRGLAPIGLGHLQVETGDQGGDAVIDRPPVGDHDAAVVPVSAQDVGE